VPDYDSTVLADGVRRLLVGPIDSFEKLALVIALRRSAAPQKLDALATFTGTPAIMLASALDELTAASVVVQQTEGWLLGPDCDRAAIDEL
jgi:hypothetical protein